MHWYVINQVEGYQWDNGTPEKPFYSAPLNLLLEMFQMGGKGVRRDSQCTNSLVSSCNLNIRPLKNTGLQLSAEGLKIRSIHIEIM